MKRVLSLVALLVAGLVPLSVSAALIVPGADGSDGALVITTNTVIDLSQAVTAAWDANNAANAGKGVYDGTKWAVVFKYSSVNISAGATVTFKNHPSRAPVVWLVSGDATIAGTVSLDGANGAVSPALADPGPGGFRGGQGQLVSSTTDSGSGFGPGGGVTGDTNGNPGIGGNIGYGGAYSVPVSFGNSTAAAYGNPSLLPLLGGSGGGGDADHPAGGGAGGGAILVVCGNSLSIAGQIKANGGSRTTNESGGGSGGGIRLVAASLNGTGTLNALGGVGYVNGGLGRIRIERFANNNTLVVTPSPSVVQIADGSTPLIWAPASAPIVEVVSVGGQTPPADPRASFSTDVPDVVLAETTTTNVVVRTTNVEQASQVKVRVTPRTNANYTEVTATFGSIVSSNPLVITWNATLPVASGSSALIVRVVRP